MRRVWITVAATGLLVVTAGCKSAGRGGSAESGACAAPTPSACAAPTETVPTVSRVLPGDTLHGRIACGTGCQCFYFDGLEYAFLDYKLSTESGCQSPVTLAITDPDGRPVDIGNGTSGKSIVLHKSGTYKGLVCGGGGGESVYAFTHDIRTVEPPERIIALTPESKEKVSFVAPRGANVVVTMQPLHACGVTPKVLAVYGPNGSRALDVEKQIQGAPLPAVVDSRWNTERLHFNAAQPGRYTVIVASEPGTEGDARTHVQVFPPRASNRDLFHDNHPCPDGGAPNQVASTR